MKDGDEEKGKLLMWVAIVVKEKDGGCCIIWMRKVGSGKRSGRLVAGQFFSLSRVR